MTAKELATELDMIDTVIESWNDTIAAAEKAKEMLRERKRQFICEYEPTTATVACSAIQLKTGLIVAGRRHPNCLAQIYAVFGREGRIGSIQGFMTTHGSFVTREEGRKLQDAAGIPSVDPGGYRGDSLYSEDLY